MLALSMLIFFVTNPEVGQAMTNFEELRIHVNKT